MWFVTKSDLKCVCSFACMVQIPNLNVMSWVRMKTELLISVIQGLGTYKKQGLRQRLCLSSNHTTVFLTYSRALSQVGTYKSSHASCQNAYHPGGNGLLSPLFVKSQCHHQSAMHWCLLPFHRKTRWTRISWPHLSSPVKRQFSHGTKSWKKDYYIKSNVIYRSNVEASWYTFFFICRLKAATSSINQLWSLFVFFRSFVAHTDPLSSCTWFLKNQNWVWWTRFFV